MNYKFKPLYEYEAWREETYDNILNVCTKYNILYSYNTILTAEEAILLKLQCPFLDFMPVADEI